MRKVAERSFGVHGERERDTVGEWEGCRERESERGREGAWIILGFHSYRKHHSQTRIYS